MSFCCMYPYSLICSIFFDIIVPNIDINVDIKIKLLNILQYESILKFKGIEFLHFQNQLNLKNSLY